MLLVLFVAFSMVLYHLKNQEYDRKLALDFMVQDRLALHSSPAFVWGKYLIACVGTHFMPSVLD